MPSSDRPTQFTTPEEVTLELLLATTNFSDILGVPFYISDYVADAAERFEALAPLSVRHCKAIVPLLQKHEPDLDPQDKSLIYSVLLQAIEEQPNQFYLYDAAIERTVAQSKKMRLPRHRIARHIGRNQNLLGDPFDRYRKGGTEAEQQDALFDLFLGHVYESAKTRVKNSTSSNRDLREGETAADGYETDSASGGASAATELTFVHGAPAIATEDTTNSQPIPAQLASDWEETCAAIESLSVEMAERLDTTGLDILLTKVEQLKFLAGLAAEYLKDDKISEARRFLTEALSWLLPQEVLDKEVGNLSDFDDDRLTEVTTIVETLRAEIEPLQDKQRRKYELEEAMSDASQRRAWSEMPALSTEHQVLIAEIADAYGRGTNAALSLSDRYGKTFSLSAEGIVTLGENDLGSGHEKPLPVDTETEPLAKPEGAEIQDEAATADAEEPAIMDMDLISELTSSQEDVSPAAQAEQRVAFADSSGREPAEETGDIDAPAPEVIEEPGTFDSAPDHNVTAETTPVTKIPTAQAPTSGLPLGDPVLAMAMLIHQDQPAIAARFGLALKARGAYRPIASDVLHVASASRLSFEAIDSSSQEFEHMVNAAIATGHLSADEEEGRSVLLFGSMLRPAVLMQNVQLRKSFGDLNLRTYGPILSELQEALAELEYQFAPKIDDLAKAAGRPKTSRLEMTRQELRAWHEQAKGRSGPCQPSTYAVHKIVTTGDVGRLVDKILQGQVTIDELNTVIDAYQEDAIEARLREINRGAGTQSRGNFPQISWRYMKRNIGEGIDLLIRFRNLSDRSRVAKSLEIDQLPQRVAALQTKVRASEQKLKNDPVFNEPGIDGALAYWLLLRLDEFYRMLSGQDITPYPTISAALFNDLDLLPTDCQPNMLELLRIDDVAVLGEITGSETLDAEHEAVLRAVLSGRVMLAKDAFEEKIDTGAFAAALRLTSRLDDQKHAAERVETERQRRLHTLRSRVGETSRTLRDLSKIDLSYQEDITREIDRLDEALAVIDGWSEGSSDETDRRGLVDVFQITRFLSSGEALIAKVQVAIREDQAMRLDEIAENGRASGAAPEILEDIDRLRCDLDTLSPEVIEDRLALIRDGRPIGETRKNETRDLEAFFPDFVGAAGSGSWPKDPEGYQQAFDTESHPELKLAPDRRAAAGGLVEAWFKLIRQLPSGMTRPAAVEGLLVALRFNSPRVQEPTRVPGVKNAMAHEVRMRVQAKDFFCPPDFGSKSGDLYKLFAIGPSVLFEHIEDHLEEQVATIILVAECMSVEKRREFAEGLRRRKIKALLIDEALIAFVAISFRPREALFDCALPFGRFDSYTTSAGKLPREMFFGRKQEIELIRGTEVDGCLVYGGRQLGKSALLAHVCELYHNKDNKFIVQWEPIKSLGASNNPASNIWGTIARKLSEFGIVPDKLTDQDNVIRHIQNWLNSSSSARILLLLDETDNFMSAEARNGYLNLMPLKSLMETTLRRFKVVFAGLHNVRRMLDEPNSPLAHFGRPICVGPLNATHSDKESARALVIEPMRAAGFIFENPMAVDDILAYVNHYPSLVQTFCKGLLQYLHRQRDALGEGPFWKIPDGMIFKGEGFGNIREEIRSKFQLTLRLDPRYALIANVLGLTRAELGDERVLRSGLSASDIRTETLKHWPEHIQPVGDSAFRALLDELSELGILSRIITSPSSSPRYVLRTRQVAQMLGQEHEIIEALVELQDREADIDYDASSYRRAYEPKGAGMRGIIAEMKRSPLTDSQLNDLLDPKQPGCRFIAGIPVMGLREVPQAVEQILGAAGGTWGQARSVTVTTATVTTFRREIENVRATRGSNQVKLIFIRADPADAKQLISLADQCVQVLSGDVRPVLLLDATDPTLRNIAVQRKAIVLLPWGNEMLRAYLQEVEANNLDTMESRHRMLELTGGIPSQLCALVARNAHRAIHAKPQTLDAGVEAGNVSHILPDSPHREVLADINSIESPDQHEFLLEMLKASGVTSPTDIIEDLRVLGFVQIYDPGSGRLLLSPFGRFCKELLKHEKMKAPSA